MYVQMRKMSGAISVTVDTEGSSHSFPAYLPRRYPHIVKAEPLDSVESTAMQSLEGVQEMVPLQTVVLTKVEPLERKAWRALRLLPRS
jgi:hypothetical protein